MMPQNLFTQEIGVGCNLASRHVQCPAHDPARYRGNLDSTRLMDDSTVVANAVRAWERGFRGHYAWHLYSEPTLYFDRIERVQQAILEQLPAAQFTLWTNGTLLGTTIPLERCRAFHRIVISNYAGVDAATLYRQFQALGVRVKVQGALLDHRMKRAPAQQSTRCFRYARELEIDAYGNWRLCCGDWEGTAVKLNVHTHGIDAILDAYEALQPLICADPQSPGAPDLCRTCRTRGRPGREGTP